MMSVKLKRLTALLLSACLAAGNITTAFGAPVQPVPGAKVRTSRLISTEETVWRYLDDNTDPAALDDTEEEMPGSPSNASPSDASPSNASGKYGFYRFTAGKNRHRRRTADWSGPGRITMIPAGKRPGEALGPGKVRLRIWETDWFPILC